MLLSYRCFRLPKEMDSTSTFSTPTTDTTRALSVLSHLFFAAGRFIEEVKAASAVDVPEDSEGAGDELDSKLVLALILWHFSCCACDIDFFVAPVRSSPLDLHSSPIISHCA